MCADPHAQRGEGDAYRHLQAELTKAVEQLNTRDASLMLAASLGIELEHKYEAGMQALREGGADDRLIHAVVCHGYGLCVDVKPEHEMEKVLFACDELTGLIGACAKMRPSGSIADMDLKSLKKKYKSKGFAAGCSREVIAQGAEMLGWTLDDLLSRTLEAMKPDEAAIAAAVAAL